MAGLETDGSAMDVLPTTESDAAPAAATAAVESKLTDAQWRAIKSILEYLLEYREEDGHDPSKVFHKRVNRRFVPTYYDVIKEPMAFSNLKAAIAGREYKSFSNFVRDCALIWHNAHTYNRPNAGAYQDASTIKSLMEEQFQQLVQNKLINAGEAQWPDLGEIPPADDEDDEDDAEEDGDEDDEDEDEDDAEDSGEDGGRRRRRPGRPSLGAAKRDDAQAQKRRGRPPKVDTPLEARIKNILRGLRRPRDNGGVLRIANFDKLPDKAAMPEYYAEIKEPMSIEQIKKSLKRKRYKTVDQFMRDIDLIFNNAKLFNQDESDIFKDAVFLQNEAQNLASMEKARPDSDFLMEEGRKPRPEGLMHHGELYKVGDWVHIQNPNDPTKPIVAQIFRTWVDADDQEWVNACWYYRPEQTVHQYEKHFLTSEVVKTGQYRDHPIEDVLGRCFVMFVTRFGRGRPRGTPPNRAVYVCEARYNEEKHRFNKIKTWASCLPDEIRDKDYEMDLFTSVQRIRKVPSPLLYMLKDTDKETTSVPKPRWGADNAPPILGGIYKGPRDDNQSPPPEPSASPPPAAALPRPSYSHAPSSSHRDSMERQKVEDFARSDAASRSATSTPHPGGPPRVPPPASSYASQSGRPPLASASPVHPQYGHPPPVASANDPRAAAAHGHAQTHDHYNNPQMRYAPQPPMSGRFPPHMNTPGGGQKSLEVFHLPDIANNAIPADIRDRFHQDDFGHVLFFSRPSDAPPSPRIEHGTLRPSIRHRAAMIRKRQQQQQQKPSGIQDLSPDDAKQPNGTSSTTPTSQSAIKPSDVSSRKRGFDNAFGAWIDDLDRGTQMIWKQTFGDAASKVRDADTSELLVRWQRNESQWDRQARFDQQTRARTFDGVHRLLRGPAVYLDDLDSRC